MSFESDDIADTVMPLNTTDPLPPFLADTIIAVAPQKTFQKADHFNIEAAEIEDKANTVFEEYSRLKDRADILRSSAYDLQRLAAQDRDHIASALEQVLQHHDKVLPRYKKNAKRAQLLNDLALRTEEGSVISEEITELYQNLQAFRQWKMPAANEFENVPADVWSTPTSRKRRRPSISSSEVGMNTANTSYTKAKSTHIGRSGKRFDNGLADQDEETDGESCVGDNNDTLVAKSAGMLEIEESLSGSQEKDNNNEQDHHSDSDALSVELGTPYQVNNQKNNATSMHVRFPTVNKEDSRKQKVADRGIVGKRGDNTEVKRIIKTEHTNHELKQEILGDQLRDESHEQEQKKPKKKKSKKAKRNKQLDNTAYHTDHNLDGKLKSSLKNMKKIAFDI